ncbi:MAG: glycogen synthase GlgA [Actinobacteria bacterium]|nr:glycogen synthase GlgA [Actinomycetota bacterium]
MNVLSVTSECFPLVKTGGLADVTGALPLALQALGVDCRVLLPAYPGVGEQLVASRATTTISDLFGGAATLVEGTTTTGLTVILVAAPHLFERAGGGPYVGPDGHDWPDNHLRFAALSWVAAAIATGRLPVGADGSWRPDVVHLHDWQAALTAAYLNFDHTAGAPPTLLTIHNLAFQGLFPQGLLSSLRLPAAALAVGGIGHWESLSFLKAGGRWCDAVSTVSPTYAREILTTEHGMGFDGVLNERRGGLLGIVNGIDLETWNPATDSHIAARYAVSNVAAGKAANKAALRAEVGLQPDSAAPLFCVISRLTEQKGLDLLLATLPRLLAAGAQLLVLGTGDGKLEDGFRRAATDHPGRVAAVIGYDEDLSHRVQAGADAIIVPSRFEPCGLTQLCGLRYGTLPLVAKVGGLADTVVDSTTRSLRAKTATGFQFTPVDAEHLAVALGRACDLFASPARWQRVIRTAMTTDVGWSTPAAEYLALYERLLSR